MFDDAVADYGTYSDFGIDSSAVVADYKATVVVVGLYLSVDS